MNWQDVYPGTDVAAKPCAGCVIELPQGQGKLSGRWIDWAKIWGPRTYHIQTADCAPILPAPSQVTRQEALAALEAISPKMQAEHWYLRFHPTSPELRAFDGEPMAVHHLNLAATQRDLAKLEVLIAWWGSKFKGEQRCP